MDRNTCLTATNSSFYHFPLKIYFPSLQKLFAETSWYFILELSFIFSSGSIASLLILWINGNCISVWSMSYAKTLILESYVHQLPVSVTTTGKLSSGLLESWDFPAGTVVWASEKEIKYYKNNKMNLCCSIWSHYCTLKRQCRLHSSSASKANQEWVIQLSTELYHTTGITSGIGVTTYNISKYIYLLIKTYIANIALYRVHCSSVLLLVCFSNL